jgi:hypothetical protein
MTKVPQQEFDLETACRTFYENYILNCVLADGRDLNTEIIGQLRTSIVAADTNFTNVDPQNFYYEITVLQFELFGLAWLGQFGKTSAIVQSTFTKKYLHEKSRDDIWDAMEPYNQAVARSAVFLHLPAKTFFTKMYVNRVNNARMNLTSQFVKEGYDFKCVVRAINRLFSDDYVWDKGTTAGLLLLALCDRLGFNSDFLPSKEARSRWFVEISKFYKEDKMLLKDVKDVSWIP